MDKYMFFIWVVILMCYLFAGAYGFFILTLIAGIINIIWGDEYVSR